MANYQKIKGTQDFYGLPVVKMRYVEDVTMKLMQNYGFSEIKTPIFENTEVFTRSAGDESDIVTKEMYTFLDKGNRSITLRPEGTAPVVRSFVENKIYANSLPLNKFFYFGPMFRYERPQAGRYREFHQFGIECFGESTPMLDADIIISAFDVFKKLNIKNIKLKINSIGDEVSRKQYAEALTSYFSSKIDTMCADCNRRLSTNPLRILDCKVDKNNPTLIEAPKISDYLTEESKNYFAEVISILDSFAIPYEVDPTLVRGLDYYTDTVFEFIIESEDELNGLAICAGGKYAGLVKAMSGIDLPGIGYAFGVERIIAVMDVQNAWPEFDLSCDVMIMALDQESKLESLRLANLLRNAGFTAELEYKSTSMKTQFKLADKLAAKFIVIIGEEERIKEQVTIKNTKEKTQTIVANKQVIQFLKENIKNENA